MQALASQSAATAGLVPCSIGWCVQLYLCGVSTDRARRILYNRKYQDTKVSGVPGTRYFLLAALIINFVYTIVTIWDITAWISGQDRTDDGINALKVPDLVGPFLGGIVGIVVPSFMAIRCWRITNRSLIFAIIITALIVVNTASLVWILVDSVLYHMEIISDEPLFTPNQVWLCTSAVTDSVITVCLMLHLKRMKRGFNRATDNFLDSLVRLAFETSFPPALASIAAAVVYAATWRTEFAWNTYFCIVPYIPSLYLLSFVFCLQATRRRGRVLSESQGPAVPNRRKHKTQSWQAPLEWESTIGTGELESFKTHETHDPSTPFASYAPAVSFNTKEPPSEGDRRSSGFLSPPPELPKQGRPLVGIRIRTESQTTIEVPRDVEKSGVSLAARGRTLTPVRLTLDECLH